MDKRHEFSAICPKCGVKSEWLFSANEIGLNIVYCEHCGEAYAIVIALEAKTLDTYELVLHNPEGK